MTVAPSNPNSPQNPNTGANQPAQQQGASAPTQSPGLEPIADNDIQVRSVNPPLTPDQIVGLYEKPLEVPALPTLKLQDIKIPPVKNKTIQAHLKAIEAKMIATEKLMKEVVKLQKLQMITEKELYERKRELYQNTFEEYLLDKTIDFEDPDDPKDCVCINLPKSPTSGGGGGALPTPTLTPTPTSPSADGQQDATQPTKKPAQQPSRQPQNPPTTPTSPTTPGRRNRPGSKPTPTPTPTPTPHRPKPPGTPRPSPKPGTPPVRRPFPPDVRPVNPPGTRPGPMPYPTPGVEPVNNIRPYAKTPVAGAQYRSGLPMGTKGSIFAMLGQFGLGTLANQQAESLINELTKLKTENPEEYKKKLNDLRWEAKNQKLLNPLMQVIGSPDVPAAYILKSLGQLKQEEIPLSLPGMNIDLMPDLNPDGSAIATDTLDTRTEFDKKHGVNYASGGIPGQDLELYSSESQNYFRNISNNIKHSIPRYAGGGLFGSLQNFVKNITKPKGLSIKGVQAGFTGMAKEGFDAIMGGAGFRNPNKSSLVGKGSRPVLGHGAYSAPTAAGASRYMKPGGGIVKSIVPGNARGINFIEPQSVVPPATFDKGKVLADKLLKGDYANSPLANKLRAQLISGTASKVGMGLGKLLSKGSGILNAPVISDMIFPEGTSSYDQVSGPNAYYNAPGYKGPKPSQTLENAQNSLMSNSSNNTPSMVPLPPNYIQIPSRKPKPVPEKATMLPPEGVNFAPSVFSRRSTYID